MGDQQELSMEEILASIRKIITTDEHSEEPASYFAKNAPLDLAQEIKSDGHIVDLRENYSVDMPVSSDVPVSSFKKNLPFQDVLQVAESTGPAAVARPIETTREISVEEERLSPYSSADHELSPEPLAEQKQSVVFPIAEPVIHSSLHKHEKENPSHEHDLVSRSTAEATASAILSLKEALHYKPLTGNDMTLEAVTLKALTPLLKKWLDENLATLVTHIVREEIQKIVASCKED